MLDNNQIKTLVWKELDTPTKKPIWIGDRKCKVTQLEKLIYDYYSENFMSIELPDEMSVYDIVVNISMSFRKKQDEFWNKCNLTGSILTKTDEEIAHKIASLDIPCYLGLAHKNFNKKQRESNYKPRPGFIMHYVENNLDKIDRKNKKLKKYGISFTSLTVYDEESNEFSEIDIPCEDEEDDEFVDDWKGSFETDCELFDIIDKTFKRTQVRALVKVICQMLANGIKREQIMADLGLNYRTYMYYIKELTEAPEWAEFMRKNGYLTKVSEGNWTNLYLAMTYGTNPLQRLEYYKEFEGVAFAKNEPDRIPDTNVKAELTKKEIPFVEKDYGRYYILTKIGEKE